MNQVSRGVALWLVLGLMVLLLFNVFSKQKPQPAQLIYSDFLAKVEKGQVAKVTIQGETADDKIAGVTTAGENFKTYAPHDPDLIDTLRDKGVKIAAKPVETNWWSEWLLNLFPILVLVGLWVFFMRQMQVGGGKAMSFGKSRAKLLTENTHKVTFADVAGIDEAKDELEEIIQFLRDPKRFTRLGGRIPKGILLVGAPGTGKTLLARAIAGEAGVPFFSISGSDFVEMFVGVGASRVRDLFVQGKKHAPCIVFIDEIDAVGRHRGAGLGGGHDEREQTLNQLLVEMDGFEANEGVILVAATNRPDVLDPALLRPGRFDRRVVVPRPDVKGREGILKVHTRKVPLSGDVEVSKIARSTPGFAGADLENLVNEAALLAARHNKDKVEMSDFELAKDKVLMGAERRSMVMSAVERRNTAYHEGGHALVGVLLPGGDPVHKATIIPRGMALGVTQQLPIDDRYTYSREYLMTRLAVMFGGRAAEELIFGQMTTGAGDDIEKATGLARKMVCEWGMSKEMGPMTFGQREEQVFLGRDLAHHKDYSEQTAVEIDREVRKLVDSSYHEARQLLSGHLPLLHAVAERLLEKEVLDGAEIEAMAKAFKEGRELPASAPAATGGPARPEPAAPGKERRQAAPEEAPVPGLPPKPVLA
ncbi:MAG: ATP-dependent zinc metalloprotease FtsH [Candidatus Binataceae bacterium]